MSQLTAQQARDLLSRRRNDSLPNVDEDTFLDWANFINRRTWHLLKDLDPEQVITESTVSVVS
jgi:hypothetical protein